MTMDERGKRWMAYMDGQMSASEALEFERSLSSEDQKRLNDEVRLESAICENLSGQECCPLALWNDLTARMKTEPVSAQHRFGKWQRRVIALAASIAIVLTSSVIYREIAPDAGRNVASGLEITEKTLDDFARHTDVPGTLQAIQGFLDKHHVGLKLASLDSGSKDQHHPVKLLGACVGSCPQGSLLELRISCCGKPIKVLIAKEGSSGCRMISRGSRCGTIRASRVSNGMIIALVGDIHGNMDLLDLLQPIAESKGSIV